MLANVEIWIGAAIALALLVLSIVIVVYGIYLVLSLGIEGLKARYGFSPSTNRQTALGAMYYDRCCWNGYRSLEERDLHVMLDDVNGQPDPTTLAYLVAHWQQLGAMAATARRALPTISAEHVFHSVSSPKQGDVSLGFRLQQGAAGETIFVDMSGSEILGSTTVA